MTRRAVAILFLLSAAAHAQSFPERCGVAGAKSEQGRFVILPRGDVWCPAIADPKAIRSFATYERERGDETGTTISVASVGIGDHFGMLRWGGSNGNGVQLSLAAAVLAQFDLGSASTDLINADYLVGIPLTFRTNAVSGLLRIYHQSSHLGDEFLLRSSHPERENLTYESVELLLSVDASALRLYGGGEYLLNRNPDDLERMVAHGGAELRPRWHLISLGSLGLFRPVAAVDLKASQEQDYEPAISIRAGLEADRSQLTDPPGRRWSLLLEYYTGPSPYGQFFRQKVRSLGIGVQIGR